MDQPSPSEQKQRVQEAFNRLAEQYDGLRFTQVCARRLLELAELGEGQQVLDLATGTGLVAGTAAQMVGPSGRVIGVDIAPQMLEQARAKFGAMGNLEFRLGDAEQLEFPAAQFDRVLCASSLFFMPDMLAVLRECKRVLKPTGRLVFSSFGAGFLQPLGELWMTRLEQHQITRPALPTLRLADPQVCRDLLLKAGFAEVEVISESLGYWHPNLESRWVEIRVGLEGLPLGRMTPAEREQIKQEHLEELQPLMGPEGLWLDVPAHFSFGRA